MTGVEIIAVVLGSVAGLGLGFAMTHRRGPQRPAVLAGDSQNERVELMGQQRLWVIAAMDRLAEAGLIEDTAWRQGHFLHDVANSVDRRCERLAAHHQLIALWASTVRTHGDRRAETRLAIAETARVDRELASLQEQIDRLDPTQPTTGERASGG